MGAARPAPGHVQSAFGDGAGEVRRGAVAAGEDDGGRARQDDAAGGPGQNELGVRPLARELDHLLQGTQLLGGSLRPRNAI